MGYAIWFVVFNLPTDQLWQFHFCNGLEILYPYDGIRIRTCSRAINSGVPENTLMALFRWSSEPLLGGASDSQPHFHRSLDLRLLTIGVFA